MNSLAVLSELINYLILFYILANAFSTNCFNRLDWLLTSLALIFSYLIRYIIRITGEEN